MSNESETTQATVPKPKPQPGVIRPKPAAVRPKPAPKPRVVEDKDYYDDEKGSSVKGKVFIGLALLAAIGGVTFVAKKFSSGSSAPARQEPVMVTFVPPPPPPPPPPKPTPPPQQEEKIVKETVQVEVKDEPEKPKDEPPEAPAVVSSNKGKGGDPTIGSSGTANPFAGLGRRGGSEFGGYFSGMQKRIAEALRTGKATRSAKLEGVQVKIWPDSNARISRVEFKSGSGQPVLDDAIRQSLLGLQLDEQMPEKVKPPIILRLNARAGFTAQR